MKVTLDLSELKLDISEEYLQHTIKQNLQSRIVEMVKTTSGMICSEKILKDKIGQMLSQALNDEIEQAVKNLNIQELINKRVETMASEKLKKLFSEGSSK